MLFSKMSDRNYKLSQTYRLYGWACMFVGMTFIFLPFYEFLEVFIIFFFNI
jgi:hypothetical protein